MISRTNYYLGSILPCKNLRQETIQYHKVERYPNFLKRKMNRKEVRKKREEEMMERKEGKTGMQEERKRKNRKSQNDIFSS